MPDRAVLQPNGRWAIFSSNVDHFTAYDGTREEILNVFREEFRADADRNAEAKLKRADDRETAQPGEDFANAVRSIALVHGFDTADRLRTELSRPLKNAHDAPQPDPNHAQDVAHVAAWLADEECRRAAGIGTAPPDCTCGIGDGLHNDRCPVFIWGHANNIGFGYPSTPEGASYQSINRAARFATTHTTGPLVKPERRIDILSFRNALERICEAYGVRLKGDTDASGDILIYDQRGKLPAGYDFSAFIRPDGSLEIAEWVLDDETGATKQ